MGRRSRLLSVAAAVLLGAACGHERPYVIAVPGALGPYTDSLPRRLTFFPHDDVMPSVLGGLLVFGRQSPHEPNAYGTFGREQCLAFLPLEGGTLDYELCPHRLIPWTDTLVDTWLEPSLSPDGTRLAFTWQRGARVSALGYYDTYLMVTPADNPVDTSQFRKFVYYVEIGPQNPRRADIATRITWVDDNRLRFLATFEHIDKVKGGGAGRVTDTIMEPLALMEADIAARSIAVVPGGDGVLAYAPGPAGLIWIVRSGDTGKVRLLDPATGTDSLVGQFSSSVGDLVVVDGDLVAIVAGGAAIERLRPSDGTTAQLSGFAGPVRRLAPAGSGRIVAEIDAYPDLFGAPPDLWLLRVP